VAFKVIKENVLKDNDRVAKMVREDLKKNKVLMINVIASPGAGKTLFLEKAGMSLKNAGISFEILTGDCFTSRDAERLDAAGLPVVQINTGNACHIDAGLVKKALEEVRLDEKDLIIIENVGNLVCPAEFDVGEDFKVAFLSTTEGHDKPIKYPLLVKISNLAIINKIDLLQYVDFDMSFFEECIHKVNSALQIMKISSKTGDGIDNFVGWIKDKIKMKKENVE